MSNKNYKYIDIQKAFEAKFDGRYDKTSAYQEGLGRENTLSPELKNLKHFNFGKLTLSLIIAEVMLNGSETEKAQVKKIYTAPEIENYRAFADKTVAEREAHINAHRVIKASEADADPFTYGLDPDEFESDRNNGFRNLRSNSL